MTQIFGMTAEYARLRGDTEHNILPDVGRSLPDQAFNSTHDAKKVLVHPIGLNKTTSLWLTFLPHRKVRSSSSFVSARKSLPGVQLTCQEFPGNFLSMN
jgi:hypothetical protein